MTSTMRAPAKNVEAAPTAQTAGGGMSHRQIMTILVGLMLGMFLAALDQTIVGTAMPKIANDLHGLNIQAWVTTAYLITSTISTPLYGKLSDLYGRKPFYLIAISIFVVGSAASAFSTSMYMLAAFRAFQGIGAGGLMSLAFTIMGDIIAPRQRARYMGYFMAVFGMSSVLGPVVGGALAGANSILGLPGWRWVFFVNVPIGIIALIVVARVLNLPHRSVRQVIDWWGAATLVIGLVPILVVAEQGQTWGWGDIKSIACYAVGAIGIAAFIVAEKLMKDSALIPLRLFKNRTFSLVIVAGVVVGVAMFGGITLIPQYLQIVKGSSPTVSGLQTLPLMVGLMAASLGSGQITARTGRYKIFPIIGAVFITGGALLFTQVRWDTPLWQPMIYMFLLGIGVGLCMQTLNLAAQNAAPAKDMGVSTASATFFRQMGGTLGVAVFLSILFSTVGNKIVSAITTSFKTNPSFVAALHNPALLHNPVDAPIIHEITSGGGGGALTDASFISQIDSTLAVPFKVGFTNSIDLVFWVAAAVGLLAFVVALFIKEIPLRNQSGMQSMMEGAEALGEVEDLDDFEAPALTEAPEEALAATNGRHAIEDDFATMRIPALTDAGVGTAIGGYVRRPDNSPVPGAVLTLINHGGQQVARTGSEVDGSYQLSAPLDGVYVLITSSTGHQPQASTLRASGAPLTVDVALNGTARATGVVRAATSGSPIPNATVTLTDVRGEVVGATATGPDGRYAFNELLGGSYTLVASANRSRPTALAMSVPETGDAVTDVELSGAASLRGVARGGAHNSPVSDARVTLVDTEGHVIGMTDTDANGGYAFPEVPEGQYTVIASGYPPVTSHRQVNAGEDGQHDVVLSHSDL
ncbi:MAG TPA: MFS transporter [Pseudonocardiaceae bacterium]|jgi:EmrB/QacA subfamily drug resistance transporter|nr:MFS transporter [Pseudonocardiaceae bacterium]